MSNTSNTPGPFCKADDFGGGGKIYQDDRGELSHRSLLRFSSTAGYEEREKIVELLNKGTHFDEMLRALELNARGLRNAVKLGFIEHPGPKQAFLEGALEMEAIVAKVTGRSTD